MVDQARDAIAILEERVARISRERDEEIAELRQTISQLRAAFNLERSNGTKHHTQPPAQILQPSASSRVTPGQFKGMTRSMALEMYMRARRHEGRIPIANAVLDLLAGGCELGPHGDRWERQIMAVARERARVFGFDRDRREIWLAPTADEPPLPKVRSKGKKFPVSSSRGRRTG